MRKAFEAAYVAIAATPAAGIVALQWLTPGSLVSGVAVGSAVPALAAAGLGLMGVGIVLALCARRQGHGSGHLFLGIGVAGVLPLLLGASWLFG